MYFFVLYAALIWATVYFFRRRWPAFVVLLASLGAAMLVVYLVPVLFEVNHNIVRFMVMAFEFLILGIGVIVAVSPRERPANPCRRCRYDLTGNQSGQCPECGSRLDHFHAVARPFRPAA